MNSLDLFSCIGSHALGLQRAGINTIALCESNPFRRTLLGSCFPKVPIFTDVRSMEELCNVQADIVIGGPPCQQTSVAAAIYGKRSGESLWRYMLEISLAVEAQWIVVEQPPGNKTWEAETGNDLSRTGFEVARFEFGANDLGAPYLRRRVFLVACSSLQRLEIAWKEIP